MAWVEGQGAKAWLGQLYEMYALERVGILASLPSIGGRDWYREGAAWLVKNQGQQGTWPHRRYGALVGTALGLLFLGKGRAPVLVTKLRILPDSVARVGEIDELVKRASRIFKRRFTWQDASWGTPLKQVLMAPIIAINGYKPFDPSPEQIQYLRQLLDNDATLLINACSPAFDRSFRQQLASVFPQAKLNRLDSDHPVYSSQYKIDPKLRFLEGVSRNCRMPIIYSSKDLSYGWATDGAHQGLSGAWANKIGINIIRYIAGKGQKLDRLRQVEVVRGTARKQVGPRGMVPPGAFIPVILRHGGDWNPDPEVMSLVLDDLRQKLPLRTGRVAKPIKLTDKSLFNYPFLIIKGHRAFSLSQGEVGRLRRYLTAGDSLLAECCCGSPGFDRSMRQLIQVLFPRKRLVGLPPTHSVFTAGSAMKPIEFTKVTGREPGLPPLEGIEIDGRTALMYLPMSAGCAVIQHSRAQCNGIQKRRVSLDLFRRIVLYVMTR